MSQESNTPQSVPLKTIDGFHLVIEALKHNVIDTIYGLPGIPITDLTRLSQAAGMRVISFRHEQHAGNAAAAAGFLTQKPGICLTGSAPGFPACPGSERRPRRQPSTFTPVGGAMTGWPAPGRLRFAEVPGRTIVPAHHAFPFPAPGRLGIGVPLGRPRARGGGLPGPRHRAVLWQFPHGTAGGAGGTRGVGAVGAPRQATPLP
jgi:hypothetical protein